MRTIILLLILSVTATTIWAQRSYRDANNKFGIGPAIGFATSNPLKQVAGNKGWGLGAGGMIQLEHFFQENFSGIAQAGVIVFSGRASGASTKNKGYTTVPIRGGINGYLGNLHLGAQIGVGLNSFNGGSATSFAYSPQIGYNFYKENTPLDFTVGIDGYAGHGGFSAFIARLSFLF